MELPNTTTQSITSEESKILIPKTLPQEITTALNDTLGDEYMAHYFYRNASNWCLNVGYKKAASFYAGEATSELEHAGMLQEYLVEWNATPHIPPIKFSGKFESLIDIINKAYTLEFALGSKYNEVSARVIAQHLPTFDFLAKFRTIQTESIAEYSDLLNAARLVDVSNKLHLLQFEQIYF